MTVYCLLTVNPKTERSCTLVLDSIRTGFPTATIHFYGNEMGMITEYGGVETLSSNADLAMRAYSIQASFRPIANKIHHAAWIRRMIENHASVGGPMAIVDGDMVFWENCENHEEHSLISGFYIPMIYNDFAQCVSMPRFHTSFLWIPDAPKLLQAVRDAYPNAHGQAGEYCPVDPYGPRVSYINYRPFFWDTCATLFGMVAKRSTVFQMDMLERYTHLNSAAFYDVMLERLDNKVGFKALHSYFAFHPERLLEHNYNQLVREYYQSKHEQACEMLKEFDFCPKVSRIM